MKAADRAHLKQLFGARLKNFRLAKGLSSSQFYALSGIDTGNLRKYESGARQPTLSTIMIMAKALEISPLELIDIDFQMPEVG